MHGIKRMSLFKKKKNPKIRYIRIEKNQALYALIPIQQRTLKAHFV